MGEMHHDSGTPAVSVEDLGLDNTFDILPPLLIGVLVGLVAWWAMAEVTDDVP